MINLKNNLQKKKYIVNKSKYLIKEKSTKKLRDEALQLVQNKLPTV